MSKVEKVISFKCDYRYLGVAENCSACMCRAVSRKVILVSYVKTIVEQDHEVLLILPFSGVYKGHSIREVRVTISEMDFDQKLVGCDCICDLLINKIVGSRMNCTLNSLRLF